jgi:hypothetical protein
MIAVSLGDYATRCSSARRREGLEQAVCLADRGGEGVLNVKGVRGVDKAQSVIVVTLLVVFAVFIVATFTQLDTHLLSPSGYPRHARSSPASRSRSACSAR